ncbi:LuxR C-terminal-related transcriptional regulator [Roseovarius aquimarinus]|uniref:LuxR C-terminal-related transcriptional regulator n=1 Tax=Roseovarius aquimarinus TaxID=1229156 RepID=A0ABW7I837_9RHOB
MTSNIQGPGQAEAPGKILIADQKSLIAEAVARGLATLADEVEVDIMTRPDDILAALGEGHGYALVLLNAALPEMRDMDAIGRVIDAAAPGRVILFSGDPGFDLIRQAMARGAQGFIPQTFSLEATLAAIRYVMTGEPFLPAGYAMGERQQAGLSDSGIEDREIRILKLIAQGMTNKEIGAEIDATETMVKMYMRTICQKLGARNRAHAVMIARERALI